MQQLELIVGNVGLRKPPKARVHAISGLAALHDLGHGRRAALDGRVRGVRNRKPDSAARQFAQVAEIQGIADCEHRAMMPEITRGLARMRASLEQGSPSWQPLVWPHSLVLDRRPPRSPDRLQYAHEANSRRHSPTPRPPSPRCRSRRRCEEALPGRVAERQPRRRVLLAARRQARKPRDARVREGRERLRRRHAGAHQAARDQGLQRNHRPPAAGRLDACRIA